MEGGRVARKRRKKTQEKNQENTFLFSLGRRVARVEALTHSATPASSNATRAALATRLWFEPGGAADAPATLVAAALEPLGLASHLAALGDAAAPTECSFHLLHSLAQTAEPQPQLGGVPWRELRLLEHAGAVHATAASPPPPRATRAALAALGMGAEEVERLCALLRGLLLLDLLRPHA